MKSFVALCLVACVAVVLCGPAKSVKKSIGEPAAACTEAGQYIADTFDCRKFYECDPDLNPIAGYCEPELCWYEATRECVWQTTGYCTTPCNP